MNMNEQEWRQPRQSKKQNHKSKKERTTVKLFSKGRKCKPRTTDYLNKDYDSYEQNQTD
jgi:Ni/Co efflux regulator RcnB